MNSDRYFVGSDSKEYDVLLRSEIPFHMVARAAERNKGLESIRYPKRYKVYIAFSITGVVMIFLNLVGCILLMENITLLPQNLQSEGLVFAVFAVIEIVVMVLTFVFAFRVKNIRKAVIDEYRKSIKR